MDERLAFLWVALGVLAATLLGCESVEDLGTSASAITQCNSGFYLSSDGTTCVACTPVDHCISSVTCTTATNSVCTLCAQGYFVVFNPGNASTCVPCNPVDFCATAVTCNSANSSQCSNCVSGHWLNNAVQDTCPVCTAITHCVSSVTCTSATDAQCTLCDSGYYRLHTANGADTCPVCAPISHCGSSVTCTGPSDSRCTVCDSGYYLSADDHSCVACTPIANCVSPVVCVSATSSQCLTCAPGYSVSHDAPADTCVICGSCPAGQYSLGTCSGGLPNCASCAPIAGCSQLTCTGAADSQCTLCQSGYRLAAGACTNIDECAEGSDTCSPFASCTDTNGSYTCACNPGYFGNGQTCTACPAGSVSSQSGAAACTPCPPGQSSNPAGTACVQLASAPATPPWGLALMALGLATVGSSLWRRGRRPRACS
jgi:hypothetical protein